MPPSPTSTELNSDALLPGLAALGEADQPLLLQLLRRRQHLGPGLGLGDAGLVEHLLVVPEPVDAVDVDRGGVELAVAGRWRRRWRAAAPRATCRPRRPDRGRSEGRWLTSSSNCLPVLNCITVGGLPPTMRLMPAVRALWPPAMAVSTQVPPAALNRSANTFTAANSPPEVHQCSTSAFISCAWTGRAAATASAVPQRRSARLVFRMSHPLYRSLLRCEIVTLRYDDQEQRSTRFASR